MSDVRSYGGGNVALDEHKLVLPVIDYTGVHGILVLFHAGTALAGSPIPGVPRALSRSVLSVLGTLEDLR
jgi:hypothetical protein